ncbi:MAG: hypothetical protein R2792_13035 [Saprospiraceae bacterium]
MNTSKPFWRRPEGVTGAVFLVGILGAAGYALYQALPTLIQLAQNGLYLAGMLAALGALVYVVLDPKARNLVWYMYKSVMRAITSIFVQIDPIGILKSYIKDLEKSLKKLSKQIGALRGQMRTLKGTIDQNVIEIRKNMALAEQAKKTGDDKTLTLSTRKAARLNEANQKYDTLYQRMDGLYKILTRMYENSEIVLEDTRDQVVMKEQEYKAIKTSHGAIQSAMSILSGNPDQRAQFDLALESLADDVSSKVGEMERFMDTSKNLMDSIDIKSGVLEEEGLLMLEKWEKDSSLLMKPKEVKGKTEPKLDISQPPKKIQKESGNNYQGLFD